MQTNIRQGFKHNLKANFKWIRQHIKNLPIDPKCKYCPLSLWRCRKRAIFQWESFGKFFIHCWILMKFHLKVRLTFSWLDIERLSKYTHLVITGIAVADTTHMQCNMPISFCWCYVHWFSYRFSLHQCEIKSKNSTW